MKIRFLLFALPLISFGCASQVQHPTPAKTISLGELEKLPLNKITEEDIIKFFGIAPMQVANEQENKIVWLYYFPGKPKRQRMNLGFDSRSHLLKSVVWFVQEGEPESNLKATLDRYPKGHFRKHSIQWQQNDFISSQTTYVDNSKGVVIEIFEGHESEVWSLSWTIPGTIKEQDGYITKMDSNKQWRIIVNHNSPISVSTNNRISR